MQPGDGGRSQFDGMAAAYASHSASSPWNAYYERPATTALLGDVAGRDVLEAGCGAGFLTEWLTENDARVTAFDSSSELLQLARSRAGAPARFVVADLAQPLEFAADAAFDLVVASLVLHYIEDWVSVLREFKRVLRPDGLVVFSTHHPLKDWRVHSPDNYFRVLKVTETWWNGATPVEVTFWRRPLTSMAAAVAEAGFVIDRLVEPPPLPELEQVDRDAYLSLSTRPRFLFFRLRKSTT